MQAQINTSITCDRLKEVFVAFAYEAFKDNGLFPNYDHLDKLIMKKIEELVGKDQPAIFTWLKDQDFDEAVKDLKMIPPIEINDINSPQSNFVYKAPDYDYFAKRKVEMARKAEPNYIQYLKSKKWDDIQRKKRARTIY